MATSSISIATREEEAVDPAAMGGFFCFEPSANLALSGWGSYGAGRIKRGDILNDSFLQLTQAAVRHVPLPGARKDGVRGVGGRARESQCADRYGGAVRRERRSVSRSSLSPSGV